MRKDSSQLSEDTLVLDQGKELRIYLFDILAMNNSLLLGMDILERKQKIEELKSKLEPARKLSGMKDEILRFVSFEVMDLDENFSKSLSEIYREKKHRGFEGLMIKPVGGIKKPSEYIGDNRSIWIKYKKDESEFGSSDNLDLIVMGAYFGTGKRKGVFGSFLLGAYEQETGKIYPVTK